MASEPLPASRGWFSRVNDFFFRPIDSATFGLIRICAGFIILYVHLAYFLDLQVLFGPGAWYDLRTANEFRYNIPVEKPQMAWGPDLARLPPPETQEEEQALLDYQRRWGADPRFLFARGQTIWSAWLHVTDPVTMKYVHAGIVLAMALFMLGLWTPVTGAVSWAGALSYVNRSHVTLFGMDTIAIILLFYLMLGYLPTRPAARALSLDRLLWRRRHPADDPDPSSTAIAFATRLMQVNFCIIYLGSGLSKLLGPAWWNGTALWAIIANYEFAPMHLQFYLDGLTWLSRHRWLCETVVTGGVVYTLALELSFPILVWLKSWRPIMVAGAILFHAGIALIMGLTAFSLLMIFLVTAFIPPERIRRLLGLAEAPAPAAALDAAPAVSQPAA